MPFRRVIVPRVISALAIPALVLTVSGCGATAAPSTPPTETPPTETLPRMAPLEVTAFLGEQRIPPGTQYAGTTVGGFSGLDRDPESGTWIVVSDDRSSLQPARFYTADLRFDGPDGALSAVELTGTTPFLRPDGTPYPPLEGGDGTTADPEDIRVDPTTGQLLWSQEGERVVPADGAAPMLIDPTVRFTQRDGRFGSELTVPPVQRADAGERGIRQNQGPEGLTFADRGNLVVTALEGPLLQDGPAATRTAGALSRIVLQTRTGEIVSEFTYPQEPIFADPVPADGFANSGVTAVLAVDDNDPAHFLVVERSFVTGVGNKIRIYDVDTTGATDIAGGRPVSGATPVTKRLLVDLADLPLASVDNIEGMAWGPDRPDGSRTLVLVSDDNFEETQVTQFVALAVR
jgi:hypothetical protein